MPLLAEEQGGNLINNVYPLLLETLKREILKSPALPKLEEIWRSENRVATALLSQLDENGVLQIRLDARSISKNLGSIGRVLLPVVLFCLHEEFPDEGLWGFCLADVEQLYNKRSWAPNLIERRLLRDLSSKDIRVRRAACYGILGDWFGPDKRSTLQLVRILRSKGRREHPGVNLIDQILTLLVPRISKQTKRYPKRLERHKGYRDHGSSASISQKARRAADEEFLASQYNFEEIEKNRELIESAHWFFNSREG